MNPRSFQTRLLFLVVMVLLPTGALVLIANLQRQQSEREKIRQQAVCVARLAAASQEYYVKQTRQLLATMTQFQFLVLIKNEGLARTGMANLKLISPDFNDFGLIERDGTVFCHTLGTNVTGEVIPAAFTKRVLEKPGFAMSDLHRDPILQQPTLQFAYPVFEKDKTLRRLMYASIKVPLLSEALADIPLPEGGVLSVMDQTGNIIAQHPAPDKWVGKNLASFPFVQKALAKTTNVFESDGFEGVKRVYALSTVMDGTTPLLFIQVSAPEKLLFAKANDQFGASLAGMLLIAVLVLWFAWWFSKRAFIRPVGAMLDATERLIEGDLSARTGMSNNRSELHVLGQRFDVMAETLGHRQKQLEIANHKITQNNTELELRVQERTGELQTLNSELEAFSYSVSHDLRAPLRHMDGFAQLLASDESLKSHAKAQRCLGLITKSAKQMGTLIDDLLSFSKMARQSMSVQTIDTDDMVKKIVADVKTDEPDREIVWTIGTLPSVEGDAATLRQVWQNLISNAVKYTRGKEPTLIEISSISEPNETVFMVADNGAGFNMKYVDKLFGVFQRLHREDEFEGTGIGLANVRRIVHRHGGRTWAEGEIGKGAKFSFSLPRKLS